MVVSADQKRWDNPCPGPSGTTRVPLKARQAFVCSKNPPFSAGFTGGTTAVPPLSQRHWDTPPLSIERGCVPVPGVWWSLSR